MRAYRETLRREPHHNAGSTGHAPRIDSLLSVRAHSRSIRELAVAVWEYAGPALETQTITVLLLGSTPALPFATVCTAL
jgi:hypothetical protein